MMRAAGIACSLALMLPRPAVAQAALRGVVVADGSASPIDGAIVEIVELRRSITTDAHGAFLAGGLRPWRYTVKVRKLGYDPAEREVEVTEGDTARVLLRLRATATALAPVTVTETNPEAYISPMSGFNDRRKAGIGTFLTNAELRKMDHSLLEDLVRQLGLSVKLTTCRGDRFCPAGRPYAVGRRGPSSFRSTICPVQVFVDGVPFLATGPPFDLSTLKVQDLGAVEYYAGASQTPLIYEKGSSMCGVLVLWTATRQP